MIPLTISKHTCIQLPSFWEKYVFSALIKIAHGKGINLVSYFLTACWIYLAHTWLK